MVVDIALKKIFTDASKDDNNNAVSIMHKLVVCSICKSNNVITDPESGEIVCSKCGMVISDKIQETRQESRTFLNTEVTEPLWLVMIWDYPLLLQGPIRMLVDIKLNHRCFLQYIG